MKKLFLTTLMAVSAAFGYSQTPYWSYGFEGGALTDAIGNDDLVQNGSSLTTVNDRFSSANDAVTLNGDYLVGGTTGSGSYSLSLWVKGAANDAINRFIADQWSNNYGYRLRLENGLVKATLRFGWTVNNQPYQSSSTGYLVGTTDVSDGDWHHIVLTAREYINNGFDYSFEYKLFIDGIEEDSDIRLVYMGSGSNRQHEGLAANSTFTIGSNVANNVSHYENTVDDVAFYKTNLSTAQINEIYNARPAAVVYVDEDAAGANDGSSWTDAFTDLAAAMDYATVIGDELWVAEGTYKPSVSTRSEYFTLATGVSLYGGFDGTETQLSQRDWRAHQTILSGDLNGNDNANVTYTESTRAENSYRVLFVEGSGTLIDGVVIEGGQANNTNDNNFNRGGAVYKSVAATDFTIKNSVIRKNVSNREGTLHLAFQGGSNNSILIESCRFENNFGRYSAGFGSTTTNGGVTEVKVYNSEFYNNLAGNVSGSDGFSGSSFGVFANDSEIDLDVVNNTFAYNKDFGGQTQDKGTILLRRLNNNGNNVLTADFHNNIFFANESSAGNVTTDAIGLMNRPSNPMNVLNFTHSNSGQTDLTTIGSTGTVSNNQNVDPQFVDGPNGDLALLATSTMIDAADGTQLPGTITEDIAGNTRVLAGGLDIGANENDPNACSPISQQPVNATACLGGNASFSVTASGSNLSYQWNFDGSPISGATSATLNITDVQASDLGNYTVDVTASCGSATSTAVSLSLDAGAPSISQQPADVSGCESDDVTIEVVATGSGLSYQWYQNGNAVSGATSSSLFFDGILTSDAGNYTVEITGGSCSVTSETGVVTVNPGPSYSQQPTAQSGCAGGSVTFTATVVDATSLQWYKDGSPLTGETGSTLTLNNIDVTDEGMYKVLAGNACGGLFSDEVALTLSSATAITTQPTDETVCAGTAVSLSVSASGDNLSYQWRKGGLPISGANSATYSIASPTIWEAGDYTVTVSGACGSTTSAVATLTVNEQTAIITQPTAATVCQGGSVTLDVAASGSGLSYQWLLGGLDVIGETSSSIDLTNVALNQAGNYVVEVSGSCGVVFSDAAQISVTPGTAILTQPLDATICAGDGVTFNVLATGDNLTYQWKKGGTPIASAWSESYVIGTATIWEAGDYAVTVSGTCGSVTSDIATLTVNELPEPVISENGGMLETGVYDTYQWYLDGVALQGETNATVAVGAPGDYTVEVTENGCTGTSAPYTPMTVGIEENNTIQLNAYPNPFNDVLNLNLDVFSGQVEVTILDMTGRVVFTSTEMNTKIQLDLNNLSVGTYALTVRGTDEAVAVSRIVKN